MPLWDRTQDVRLAELYGLGLSFGEIGKAMRLGRSAIAGRINRLRQLGDERFPARKLQQPREDQLKKRMNLRRASPYRAEYFDLSPFEEPDYVAPPTAKRFEDLKVHDCRFPYGDYPYLFCSSPKEPGSSYCAAHKALCQIRRPA